MKDTLLAAGAVIAALAFGPQAQASLVQFGFSGAGVHGSGFLTVTPDTVVGDPSGAYTITNVTGTFSDSNIGISHAAITGLVPINPVNPPIGAPAPVSLSYLFVTNPPPFDTAISYDNLFYPGGSPITCADYPLSRGVPGRVWGAVHSQQRRCRGPLEQRGRPSYATQLRCRRNKRSKARSSIINPTGSRLGGSGARLSLVARQRSCSVFWRGGRSASGTADTNRP